MNQPASHACGEGGVYIASCLLFKHERLADQNLRAPVLQLPQRGQEGIRERAGRLAGWHSPHHEEEKHYASEPAPAYPKPEGVMVQAGQWGKDPPVPAQIYSWHQVQSTPSSS